MERVKMKRRGGEKFVKGDPNPGRGRPKGSENKMTRILKEAVVVAAELVGNRLTREPKLALEGSGLVAYLEWAAEHEPKAFLTLLGKVLPLQLHARSEFFRRERYVTVEEARARLRERGIPIEAVKHILLEPDDDEPDSDTKH
jgi:hypothetical protein